MIGAALRPCWTNHRRKDCCGKTMAVTVGEFGRPPKLGSYIVTRQDAADGRDQWPGVFFAVRAGAGVRGGQMIGGSLAREIESRLRLGAIPCPSPGDGTRRRALHGIRSV